MGFELSLQIIWLHDASSPFQPATLVSSLWSIWESHESHLHSCSGVNLQLHLHILTGLSCRYHPNGLYTATHRSTCIVIYSHRMQNKSSPMNHEYRCMSNLGELSCLQCIHFPPPIRQTWHINFSSQVHKFLSWGCDLRLVERLQQPRAGCEYSPFSNSPRLSQTVCALKRA